MASEEVQVLVDLGLTVLQAKAYIALAKLGTATGRTIAQTAKIAPPDIYRVLSELQEYALVQKIISRPNKYTAIPMKEGTERLLQRREKRTADLKKLMVKIFTSYSTVSDNNYRTDGFILEPGKESVISRAKKLFETARTSLDLMGDVQHVVYMSTYEAGYENKLQALNRGVKIRELLSKTNKRSKIPKRLKTLQEKKPDYKIKEIAFPVPATLIIKDSEEVLVATINCTRFLEYPSLWSNNPAIVQIMQQWYSDTWEKVNSTQTVNSNNLRECIS